MEVGKSKICRVGCEAGETGKSPCCRSSSRPAVGRTLLVKVGQSFVPVKPSPDGRRLTHVTEGNLLY